MRAAVLLSVRLSKALLLETRIERIWKVYGNKGLHRRHEKREKRFILRAWLLLTKTVNCEAFAAMSNTLLDGAATNVNKTE